MCDTEIASFLFMHIRSGLFLCLDEDEAMTLTGMLAQGKSSQRFSEIFHLKLDFLMLLDDREWKLISDWFQVLGDGSCFQEEEQR